MEGSNSFARIAKPNFAAVVFVAIWIGYYALLASIPFSTPFDTFSLAIGYQILFVGLTVAPFVATSLLWRRSAPTFQRLSPNMTGAIVAVGLLLSVLALISLAYDKLFLLGIDYTKGVCLARYEMGRLGEGRVGPNSAFSFFGHLFGYSYFVPLAVVMVMPVSRRLAYLTVVVSFVCLMAMSFVASSRSAVLVVAAFVLAFVCIRLILRTPMPRLRLVDYLAGAAMALIAVGFVLQVFNCRANASGMTASEYAEDFAEFLGAKATGRVLTEEELARQREIAKRMNAIFVDGGSVTLAVLYAVHSAYTFSGILALPDDGAWVMFSQVSSLLRKAGIRTGLIHSWTLSGRFSSLPGALYHAFKLWGIVAGALLLGGAAAGMRYVLERRGNSVVLIGVTAAIMAIMFLSPIHFAADFVAFPFICFSFLAVPSIAALVTLLVDGPRKSVVAADRAPVSDSETRG